LDSILIMHKNKRGGFWYDHIWRSKKNWCIVLYMHLWRRHVILRSQIIGLIMEWTSARKMN